MEIDRARFCLATGQTAEFYDTLTVTQRNVWIDVYNDMNE